MARRIAVQDWEVGRSTTYTVPAVTSGSPAASYSASGLPAGVTFDVATRVLTINPTTTGSGEIAIVATVAGTPPLVDQYFIPFIVHPAFEAPQFPTATGPAQTWYLGDAIRLQLPEATGVPDPTYSISGMPAGMTFDPETRQMSGTFGGSVTTATQNVVMTASNTSADTTDRAAPETGTATYTLPFTLSDFTPVWDFEDGGDLFFNAGTFARITMPQVDRGRPNTTYSLSARDSAGTAGIPAGLAFNSTTRELFGIPTTAGSGTIFVFARNPGGSSFIRYSYAISQAATVQENVSFTAQTLSAAGSSDPQDLWSDSTDMRISDANANQVFTFGLGTRTHRPTKDFDNLIDNVVFSPTGIWGSSTISDGGRLFVADEVARLIHVFRLTDKTYLPAESIPLVEVEGDAKVKGLWGLDHIDTTTMAYLGTTLYCVYQGANQVIAYDRGRRARDSARDITSAYLPTGRHSYYGIWSNGTQLWISDQITNEIYCLNLTTRAREGQYDFPSIDADIRPVILHAADIPFSTLSGVAGIPDEPAFTAATTNPATNTVYIAFGISGDPPHSTTEYQILAFTNNVFDAARSITKAQVAAAGHHQYRFVAGMTFDGTGLLLLDNLGIVNGINLDGSDYAAGNIAGNVVQTAFLGSTGNPRTSGMTKHGDDIMIVDRYGNVRAFRNGAHRTAGDLSSATALAGLNAVLERPADDLITDGRFSGLASNGTTLWIMSRITDSIVAFTGGEVDRDRSLPNTLVAAEVDRSDFQPFGMTWTGNALLLTTQTPTTVPDDWNIAFGYGFESIQKPAGLVRGLHGSTTHMFVVLRDGSIRAYNLPATS